MLYLGFDAGSQLFGVSAIHEGKKIAFMTSIPRPYPKDSRFLKEAHAAPVAQQVTDIVRDWIKKTKAKELTLTVEEYYPGRGNAQWVVPWLQAYVLGYFIRDAKIEGLLKQLNYVMPSVWKKNLIGKRTNGKEMVMDFVQTRCHLNEWKAQALTEEQDQYDAFGIAYYGFLLSKGEAIERNTIKHHSVKDGALF